jgi:Tol biopolymer transport system component
VSGTDKCGKPRTVACGTCASPRTCGGSGTPNLCTLPLGDHPGVTVTKLSSDTPKAFFPSPNERHVAYSNTMTDSGWFGCEPRVGMGDLYVATPGATPVVQSIPGRIGFRETVFTKDSSVLVYTLYANSFPCSSGTTLRYTAADGTNSRFLNSTGYYQNIQAAGSSVFYIGKSASSGDPGSAGAFYASGSSRYTTSLGYGSGRSAVEPSPDGSAVLFDNSDGVWTLQKLTSWSGTPLMVSPQKYLYGRAWSPDSSTLAFIHATAAGEPRGLSLLSADGKTRRELTPDCQCTNVLFSPDGTRVAYDSADVDGKGRLVIQSLLGGEPVVLTGLPSTNGGKFVFSPDGRWVRAELATSGSYSYPLLFLADTTRSGSFVQLASTYNYGSFTATPSWEHVAVRIETQTFMYSAAVFPSAGGMLREPVSTGVLWLGYPPAASEPKLAVFYWSQNSADFGTLALFNADGSGPPLTVSTETWSYGSDWRIVRPFWAGQRLLHSVNRREDPTSGEKVFDLAAVSLDGTVSGLVARDVLQVSRLENPTRIFFTRSRQSGGGLWMLELPATSP